MKVYLAGEQDTELFREHVPRRLMSYYYHGYQADNMPSAEVLAMQGKDLFLDSGAFTAFTKGTRIPIAALVEFCRRTPDTWTTIAAMDVIGDEAASWAAYQTMRAEGVPAIPTFHYGEPWSALHRMCAECDYIAFGGLVGVRSDSRKEWLQQAWNIASDEAGVPLTRVHGFGVTTLDLMTTFPWHSVDSTSWIKSAAFGQALFPMLDGTIVSVVFSESSPEARKLDGWHYANLAGVQREAVDAALAVQGFTAAECTADYKPRLILNARTYQSFETKGVTRFTMQQPTFEFD